MHMASIEALNKLLAGELFKVQDAQELLASVVNLG